MDVEQLIVEPSPVKAKKILLRGLVVLCGFLLVICIVLAILYSTKTSYTNPTAHPTKTTKPAHRPTNSTSPTSPTSPTNPTTLPSSSPKAKYKTCLDDQCFDIAKEMVHKMDLNVNPCQDFYSYACGGWEQKHPLTGNDTSVRQLFLLEKKNLAILKNVLEQSSVIYSKNVTVMKSAKVYKSCLNTTAISSQGLQPMKSLIAKYGGWSVSNNYDVTMSIHSRIGKVARDLNVNTLFGVKVLPDMYDSTQTIIKLLAASTLPYAVYHGTDADAVKERKKYKALMKIVGEWFGGFDSYQKMMAIYDFEANLAKIARGEDPEYVMRESFLRNSRSTSNFPDFRITIDDFCYKTDIPCYLLKEILQTVIGRNFAGNEYLMDGFSSYISYFKRLYNYFESSELTKTVGDYITWRTVLHHVSALPIEYSSKVDAILGSPSRPRWMFCIASMLKSFDMPLGLMYVNANFHDKSRTTVEQMTDNIRHSFIARLPKQSWMDWNTQRKAKEKALAIKISIGYPDYIKDAKTLDDHYKTLSANQSDFFGNFKEMNRFLKMRNVKAYGQPVNKKAWPISPAEVNGFYVPVENRIIYLAGIIQPPLFDPHSPSYLNYGGIGSVIGHELTHGFDSTGRLFDKKGDLDNWWSYSAAANFKYKSSCLVNQYNKYKVFDKKVNGTRTLNENIADDGGIKIAYGAYQQWVAKNGQEKVLPGLNLDPDQLFFVGFAQLWCSVYNRKGAIQQLKDVHSPGKYRVLGSLSNFEKFSQAFQCPTNSPMNPSSKCSVW